MHEIMPRKCHKCICHVYIITYDFNRRSSFIHSVQLLFTIQMVNVLCAHRSRSLVRLNSNVINELCMQVVYHSLPDKRIKRPVGHSTHMRNIFNHTCELRPVSRINVNKYTFMTLIF